MLNESISLFHDVVVAFGTIVVSWRTKVKIVAIGRNVLLPLVQF